MTKGSFLLAMENTCPLIFTGPRGGIKDGIAESAMIALYGAFELQAKLSQPLRIAPIA